MLKEFYQVMACFYTAQIFCLINSIQNQLEHLALISFLRLH